MNTQRAVKAKIDDRINAERYRKLRAWQQNGGHRFWNSRCEPFDDARFDKAVDALPDPGDSDQNQEIA